MQTLSSLLLKLAVSDAAQTPVRLQRSSSRIYRAVIGIAYHLQKRAGNRDIVLPQVRIAHELNVSQRTVSSHIAVAIDRGLLIIDGSGRAVGHTEVGKSGPESSDASDNWRLITAVCNITV